MNHLFEKQPKSQIFEKLGYASNVLSKGKYITANKTTLFDNIYNIQKCINILFQINNL